MGSNMGWFILSLAIEAMLGLTEMIGTALAIIFVRIYLLIVKAIEFIARLDNYILSTMGGVLVIALITLAALIFG